MQVIQAHIHSSNGGWSSSSHTNLWSAVWYINIINQLLLYEQYK